LTRPGHVNYALGHSFNLIDPEVKTMMMMLLFRRFTGWRRRRRALKMLRRPTALKMLVDEIHFAVNANEEGK